MKKKQHPKFFRSNYGRKTRKRVKDNWRKPRGIDSKKREKIKYVGKEPNIGWKNPKSIRGLHPSGFREILVSNLDDIEGIDNNMLIRIRGCVGKKKREEIIKKAEKLGIKILNK